MVDSADCSDFKVGGFVLRALLTRGGDDTLQFDDGLLTGDAFDDTGLYRVWPAASTLCAWLVGNDAWVRERRVLELGAGTALPSQLCARFLGANRVIATDSNKHVIEKLLESEPLLHAVQLCFDDAASVVDLVHKNHVETILLADVVYPCKDSAPLLITLSQLMQCDCLKDQGLVILVALTYRDPSACRRFVEEGLQQDLGENVLVVLEHVNPGGIDPLYGHGVPVHIYSITRRGDMSPACCMSTKSPALGSGRSLDARQ